MKIVDVRSFDLVIPHEAECRSVWDVDRVEKSRKFTLVIVYTDEDICGFSGGNGHLTNIINTTVKPFLIGESPFKIEKHLEIFLNARTWFVEVALWDIIGKKANLPLYKLWGTARNKVMAYASTHELGTPAERAGQAKHYQKQGFKALKIRFHSETMQEDLSYLDAVIDAVGENMDIMVDANQATPGTLMLPSPRKGPKWDYQRAFRTAKELENRGVVWLEEPLERWDFENLARLTRNTEIYIAGGEMNIAPHEFRWMIEKKCYDILQPDPIIAETLSQTLKIKALCETFNIHFMPHHGVSGIGLAVNTQLLCTYPGWTYIEYMYDPPYRTIETYLGLGGIIKTPLRIDNEGYISPPSLPGIGIEIDEELINDYIVL